MLRNIYLMPQKPKDKGPFPEYTLWYRKRTFKNKFKNPKDKQTIKIIRNDWGK